MMDIGMKGSTAEALLVMVPDTKEDSVDIYDGLDNDPSSNRENSPDAFQLKESMDLYEEIVTEEQQTRESTHLELMSRFQAAQTQIKELHKRLEQMELQNTKLNTENYRLKKNISALLQTARREVMRKDAEIQRLSQRPDRGSSHHVNYLAGKSLPQRSPEISGNRQVPTAAAPLALPQPQNQARPALPPPPSSPPRRDHPGKESCQPSRNESTSPASAPWGASKATSSSSHSKSSSKRKWSPHHSDLGKQRSTHREEKHHPPSGPPEREGRSSHPSKDWDSSERKGCKPEESAGRSAPGPWRNRNYSNDEGHHGMKIPPLQNPKGTTSSTENKRSHERRQDTANLSATDPEDHVDPGCRKPHSRAALKCPELRIRRSDVKEQKKISPKQRCQSDCLKKRTGDRAARSDARKEERLHAGQNSRKWKRSTSSSPQRSRSCAKRSSTERDGCRKERKKPSRDEPNAKEKKRVKEGSPHRKLCFMETLNLTRSPMKRPAAAGHGGRASAASAVEKEPSRLKSPQPDMESMHIIDGASGSKLEDAAKEPQQGSHAQRKCREDGACAQAEECSGSKSIASEQQLEQHLAPTVAADVQPAGTAEDRGSVSHTRTSPDSSSLQAGSSGSETGRAKMASNSHVDDPGCEPPAAGVTDCSSSSKNNVFESSLHEPCVTGSSPKLKNAKALAPAFQPEGRFAVSDGPDAARSQEPGEEPRPPAACSLQETDSDVVSSTISLESLPQEGLSLPEAIYILTQADEPAGDGVSTTSRAGCLSDAATKISSPTQEPRVTPVKSFREEPAGSKAYLHDEDSMMRILSHLKSIPDAISPLRSPPQPSKRSHLCAPSRLGHVKSLEKEFSNTAVEGTAKKLDVNKENRSPGSPAKHEAQSSLDKASSLPLNLSDTELEEGEISSESEERATDSPVPAPKRLKLARPVRNKASPKTVWNKTSKERCATSKEANLTIGLMLHSPKSRFKTVCPTATKSAFSTLEEVLETFTLVRNEIRKKYMKLHKTFPRKSFNGVMDNFQESFLEFVEGACLGRICAQQAELKSKLKKVITSAFRKVANNGIVKRIFDQQAADLKKKLWDFVDKQVGFLFQKISSTLKAFCKRAATEAEESRPGTGENGARQAPASGSKYQPKEAQPPTESKPTKPGAAAAPYRTGLGSRGKDIRIIHADNEERKAEPHPRGRSASLRMAAALPGSPEKSNAFGLPSHGSLLDKTDFELLTEQQASSLTFNLVRDTQMGEIFKCLLQGTDMLESSGVAADSTPWPLGTPRKDGERFISISTPSKFDSPAKFSSKLETPSKLIGAWSKIASPPSEAPLPLNPALFDESCLLEVPSETRAQSSYLLLADDLAVSLTIPSPLKSDSHLSFLQPATRQAMSTPDSVISAHISEDALLDGEDATEQDIHLALDTDNSSCSSAGSSVSAVIAAPFVFKPDQPMQALVMEKSNDHFIVKIRQAAACAATAPAEATWDHATQEFGQPRPKVSTSPILPGRSSLRALPAEKEHRQGVRIPEGGSLTTEKPNTEELSTSGMCSAVSGPTTLEPKDVPTTHVSDGALQNLSHGEASLEPAGRHASQILQEVLRRSQDTAETDRGPHKPAEPDKKIRKSAASELDRCKTGASHLAREQGQRERLKAGKRKIKKEKSMCKRRKKQEEGHEGQEDRQGREGLEGRLGQAVQEDQESKGDLERHLGQKIQQVPEGKKGQRNPEVQEGKECQQGPEGKEDQQVHQGQQVQQVQGVQQVQEVQQGQEVQQVQQGQEVQQGQQGQEVQEVQEVQDNDESKSSPNSLYANNVVKKKGAVVVSWTRDEDRALLMELKANGASRRTFSVLSRRLQKPSGQIAQRFYQLMKLYQKQGKSEA